MESTGVYWEAIFNILEVLDFELLVVNSSPRQGGPRSQDHSQGRRVAGRPAAAWAAPPSFIPDRWQRERRELVRYWKTLVEERSRLTIRVQKLLEGANVKLGDNRQRRDGMSAPGHQATRRQDRHPRHGQAGGLQPADQAAQLERALSGSVGKNQRFMLDSLIRLVEELDDGIEGINDEVEKRMRPFRAALALLNKIPASGSGAPSRSWLRPAST